MNRPYKQFEKFSELEEAVKDGSAVPLDHVIESDDEGHRFKVYRGKSNIGAPVYTGTSPNPDLEDLKQKVHKRIFSLSEEEQGDFMRRFNRTSDPAQTAQQSSVGSGGDA